MRSGVVASLVAVLMLSGMVGPATPVTREPSVSESRHMDSELHLPLLVPDEVVALARSCLTRPCLSNAETMFYLTETAQHYLFFMSGALQQQLRDEANGDEQVRADLKDLIRDVRNIQTTIARMRIRATDTMQSRR